MSSKYDALRRKLESLNVPSWTATFSEIEGILGFTLPASARDHRAWWANGEARQLVQHAAWINAGWKVENVNALRGVVTFARSSHSPPTIGIAPNSKPARELPASRPEEVAGLKHEWDVGDHVDLRFVFDWVPIGGIGIDSEGKLRFPIVPSLPGLYRFRIRSKSGEATYIGETEELRRRFQAYRTPGVGQLTNIRIRKQLVDGLSEGAAISVAIITSGVWVEAMGKQNQADLSSKIVRRAVENIALLACSTELKESLNR